VPADVSDYLRILLGRRHMIQLAVTAGTVAALLFSFLAPQVYRAEVSLIPEQSKGFSFSGLGGNAAVLDFLSGTGGPRTDARLFLELLESRAVMERVVRKLDLVRIYRLQKLSPSVAMEEATILLQSSVDFRLSDAGIIHVFARAATGILPTGGQRQQAADQAAAVANAFAEELDAVNREKSTSRARMVREYLEVPIRETEQRARILSDSLTKMQVESGMIALDEQTKAAVLSAGELRGRLLSAEIELGILRRTMRPDNPQMAAMEARVSEMQRQYDRIQFGPSGSSPAGGREFTVPFAQLPAVAQKQGWVMQELKIQQTVYELLSAQFYQARIQETGEVPSFSVLDAAQPPVYRSWPKRKVLLLSVVFVAGFVSALLAFFLEFRDRRAGRPVPPGPRSLTEAWAIDRAGLARLLSPRSGVSRP
jgi:tyrosine-protein kinase Etk/Wzc